MGRKNEFYKKIHPDQFSDSVVIKKGHLDRDMLDYFLDSITSKNLEKTFEEFCRKIAEAEICPNLLPQTGPTGGGDSKVDSETYPVAKSISDTWYYGSAAASERWAFAISAKKDWNPKVKSDIKKIALVNQEENRGYTKIFFMSNQYIPDKKRAQTEDDLRSMYNLDIRILDRNWLLNKVFLTPQNIDLTISVFDFSDNFRDEVKTGSRDLSRKEEFEDNERKLSSPQTKPSEAVALAQRSVILARELEYPMHQIDGLIRRSIRISKESGGIIDHANAVCDAAWTIYWWYEDDQLYYNLYKEFEELVLKSKNVNLFINLTTLWINLFSLSQETKAFSIDVHTQVLKDEYSYYISNPSRPNTAIEAKSAFQMVRFFLGDDPDSIVDDIIQILEDSAGHLDLDIRTLCRAIQEFPVFEHTKRFDEMFERSVDIMSAEKQNIEAANLLYARGHKLKDERPYDALVYFSRTLTKIYNAECKEFLAVTIMEMADIFQNTGLFWAARNFYYYNFILCLNQYFKYGEVSPVLYMSAYSLENIELRLGHILHAIVFHKFSLIAEHIYPGDIMSDEDKENFDYALAIQLLRTPYETANRLGEFPAFLDEYGLTFSRVTMKYKLGHYDEEMLSELDHRTEVFDDVIAKWNDQPAAKQMIDVPWYGFEDTCMLHSKVLGCSIDIAFSAPYTHGEFEFAATILATIESFLGSGLPNQLMSLQGKIEIKLRYDDSIHELIHISFPSESVSSIDISFRDYDAKNIILEQERFSEFINCLLSKIISIMFPIPSELKKVEKMIKNDAAFERSGIFANSIFFGQEVLGRETFSYPAVVHDYPSLEVINIRQFPSTDSLEHKKVEFVETPKQLCYDFPPDVDFSKISNADMCTSSIINVSDWNKAQWKGVMFQADKYRCIPPVISFVFGSNICKTIWENWKKEIGEYDILNQIGIRIIKKIDKKHPFWYRVAIGPHSISNEDDTALRIISSPLRLHTMQPMNDTNLSIFERELKNFDEFYLFPACFEPEAGIPHPYTDMGIRKKRDSIIICDASDIPENDFLCASAIIAQDDPIIPAGKEESPIVQILKHKRDS